jgi:alpha-ketoglutarate-dependent taurine dioxygenase
MQVRDLKPGFGSFIAEFDPNAELVGEAGDRLRRLFDERGALIFRGLNIDHDTQGQICRALLGDDTASISHPDFDVSNKEPEANGASGRLQFHADSMWHPEPTRVLSLYGREIGGQVATTSIASGIHGYEMLPADLRARIEGLRCVQVTGPVPGRAGDDIVKPIRTREDSTEKDVVQICPRSGKKILYVCPQTSRNIVGMSPEASEELLQTLFSYLYRPENIYEHSWEIGDLLVLNNIAMQHARSYVDPYGPVRVLHKVIAPVSQIGAETPRFVAPAN